MSQMPELTHMTPSQTVEPKSFHGASMYTSIAEEFDAASSHVALIDRSWMGMLELRGADSLDFLHRLSTNDLLRTRPGDVRSTVLLTEKGRIIDYIHVLVGESSSFLQVSPGNEERVQRWLEKYTIMEDVQTARRGSSLSQFTLLGPLARDRAEEIFRCSLPLDKHVEVALPFASVRVSSQYEFHTTVVDMIVEQHHASALWNFIVERSQPLGVRMMGTAAYEAYRISRGIPAIGAELSENFNPFEVGLRGAISFSKGCYIGQEVIARLDTYQKVQREPWGLVFDADEPIPTPGSPVHDEHGEIGVLTSMSEAVVRGRRCGIGILKKNHVHSDDLIRVTGDRGFSHGVCKPFPVLL